MSINKKRLCHSFYYSLDFYCVQVYYMDSIFAMGHVVIRRKRTVVGDETPEVILFRCIQNMNPVYPFNTCYTGGEPLMLSND